LRDEGMLFWFFDHLALRLALASNVKDAALVAGYADSLFKEFGRPREPVGQEAVNRLQRILRTLLSDNEVQQAHTIGAQLSEDRVIALALSQ
jgi:hypothetical protein